MAEFEFREVVPKHGTKRGASAAYWNKPKAERRRLRKQFEEDLKDSLFADLLPENLADQ